LSSVHKVLGRERERERGEIYSYMWNLKKLKLIETENGTGVRTGEMGDVDQNMDLQLQDEYFLETLGSRVTIVNN
jgi:hypothetical protein